MALRVLYVNPGVFEHGGADVEEVATNGDPARLMFLRDDVLIRLDRHGDLFASVATLEQQLGDAV